MSSAAAATTQGDQTPAGAFGAALNAFVSSAAAGLEKRVSAWADRLDGVATGGSSSALGALVDTGLDDLAQGGGAKQAAGAEAMKASLHGKNPVWAAVGGAWREGTPAVRAAIIVGGVSAVLLLLLSPVLLLVFLLCLLVIAAVQRARTARSPNGATRR